MKKRNILRTLFFLLAITATVLAFSMMDKPVAADSACKESMEGCPKQQKAGTMIMENLSRQFFSSI